MCAECSGGGRMNAFPALLIEPILTSRGVSLKGIDRGLLSKDKWGTARRPLLCFRLKGNLYVHIWQRPINMGPIILPGGTLAQTDYCLSLSKLINSII